MIYGAKALIERGTPLDGDLYVVAVIQEEPDEGMAMRHIVEQGGLRPDWVVLGEPTNLQLARGQRGRLEVQVTVHGRSAHAASPERGVNAIYGAARVIVALEMLALQLSNDPFLGRGSIAVTDIRSAADSKNAIPESCALTVDRRLTIGETEAKALAEIRRILNREGVSGTVEVPVHQAVSYHGYPTAGRQYLPYWVTPEDDPLLVAAVAAIEDVLNFVPHVGRWDFSTDGVYTAARRASPPSASAPATSATPTRWRIRSRWPTWPRRPTSTRSSPPACCAPAARAPRPVNLVVHRDA
jgi:putative selenium metabolism hydrolase